MSNIESRVIKVITWCMGMPGGKVRPDMTVEELGIDSLDIVEVTLAIVLSFIGFKVFFSLLCFSSYAFFAFFLT